MCEPRARLDGGMRVVWLIPRASQALKNTEIANPFRNQRLLDVMNTLGVSNSLIRGRARAPPRHGDAAAG